MSYDQNVFHDIFDKSSLKSLSLKPMGQSQSHSGYGPKVRSNDTPRLTLTLKIPDINPFEPSGISHYNQLDSSISVLRAVG